MPLNHWFQRVSDKYEICEAFQCRSINQLSFVVVVVVLFLPQTQFTQKSRSKRGSKYEIPNLDIRLKTKTFAVNLHMVLNENKIQSKSINSTNRIRINAFASKLNAQSRWCLVLSSILSCRFTLNNNNNNEMLIDWLTTRRIPNLSRIGIYRNVSESINISILVHNAVYYIYKF